MKIVNHTSIPNEVVKDVIRFVRPPGIKNFTVVLKDSHGSHHWRGWGYSGGVNARLKINEEFPFRLWTYQYGQLRGRRYYIASPVENLIYLLAHELMHTRQGQRGPIRGRVWGARGRYSEIETESYAIRKLREWRRLYQ